MKRKFIVKMNRFDRLTTNIPISRQGYGFMPRTKFLCDVEFSDKVQSSMIRLIIKEVAMKEGILNPFDLSSKTGIPYESCRLMWGGNTKRIDLKSIEKICKVLGVRPGQLFEYQAGDIPDAETNKPKQQKKAKPKA
jgi:DNA-binding Xre family transcriptional regulator